MREYWEIEDNHVANLPPMIQQGIKEYRKHQKSGKPSMPGQWAHVTPHIGVISALRLGYRRHPDNRAVDDALAKWGYRGVPGNMDIRMKYADTRFLPDEPGGPLQPQQGRPQPQPQPQPQPSGVGSIIDSLLEGLPAQPRTIPSPPATPSASGVGSIIENLLAGAR